MVREKRGMMFDVPLYKSRVTVIISENCVEERRSKSDVFGEYTASDLASAIASDADNEFGLFFEYSNFNLEIMAHEVFHLTMRVLHNAGVKFDIDNHEAYAYLHGELMQRIHDSFGDLIYRSGDDR